MLRKLRMLRIDLVAERLGVVEHAAYRFNASFAWLFRVDRINTLSFSSWTHPPRYEVLIPRVAIRSIRCFRSILSTMSVCAGYLSYA